MCKNRAVEIHCPVFFVRESFYNVWKIVIIQHFFIRFDNNKKEMPMFEKFTVIDVETPDNLQTRICSIGITQIENGEITGTENYLINPECDFNVVNISKHGIRPEDVKDKPTFKDFWQMHSDVFYSGIVAGYGIAFDLSALKKTLKAYGIEAKPFQYIDIMKLVKSLFLDLPNYKLPTICNAFAIELKHHNSGSDSLAEATIFQKIRNNCTETMLVESSRTFDLNETESKPVDFRQREAINLSPETRALRSLKATIEDLSKEGTITFEGFVSILDCISKNCIGLYGHYPFDEIIVKINNILDDGEVTKEELEDFTQFCNKAFNPVDNTFDEYDGCLIGKHVVLTGDFAIKKQQELEKELQQQGVII